MRTIRPGPRRVRKNTAVLMCLTVVSLFFVANGLLADPPDSVKPTLREGTFVMRDTTTHPPSPVSAKALERLNANTGTKWSMRWNELTGVPEDIGGLTKIKYSADPAEAALAFIDEYKDLFTGSINPGELAQYSFQVERVKSFNVFTMVSLESYFKDVRIYKGGLGVQIASDGRIQGVHSNLRAISLTTTDPSLSPADIEQLIQKAAAPKEVFRPSQIIELIPEMDPATAMGEEYDEWELVIYPSSPPRLAYRGSRFLGGMPLWSFIIDAHTGEIIYANDNLLTQGGGGEPVGWAWPTIAGRSESNYTRYNSPAVLFHMTDITTA